MISIPDIRNHSNKLVVLGNHQDIIQSILDFDYLSGKPEGSILAIVTGRRGHAKYFFGRQEILIPTFQGLSSTGDLAKGQVGTAKLGGESLPVNFWLLNLLSGRRTLSSTQDFLSANCSLPTAHCAGAVLFAENVPELHSLELINLASSPSDTPTHRHTDTLIIGPASVGLIVPGHLKLGPIGGITPEQIQDSHLTQSGHVAVLSASGGMTNELINIAISEGHYLSFALSFGGDRFPALSPREAFLLAEADPETKTVLYYGELGGVDEYELVELARQGKFTKHVIAHIAGTVASLFPDSPQFGHAKAKADKEVETALAKREALRQAGFSVSDSFSEFISLVAKVRDCP